MGTSEICLTPDPGLGIDAVERETGLGKELLRVWERRYGFPRPERDAAGQRIYPWPQIERLRLLRRLVAAGHRPGRLMVLGDDALSALAAPRSPVEPGEPVPPGGHTLEALPPGALPLDEAVDVLRTGGSAGVSRWLSQALARQGLSDFVTTGLGPLLSGIGLGWLSGQLAVYEEHLFTETARRVLSAALLPLQQPPSAGQPRVLLTTVPGEAHQMGLLMAEAMLLLEGAHCLALGPETPLADIQVATRRFDADIVALSFSGCLPGAQVSGAVQDLRRRLPAGVELWIGGAAVLPTGADVPGLRTGLTLPGVASALEDWRRRASGLPSDPVA